MDVVPVERAIEPDEQARQPKTGKEEYRSVTFVETNTCNSQHNSVYKNGLSQPSMEFTHKQKLLWLQQRREVGLWAQCDDCSRWRYLPHVLEAHELPAKWFCWMNPDISLATCSAAEVPICIYDEDDLIHAEYSAGSVVLARMPSYPWWPAMVCDCPDTEQYYWLDGFSDIPTFYNVVFFDALEVSRAWLPPHQLMPYKDNKHILKKSLKIKNYNHRLDTAITQANDAVQLPLSARLAKYSFVARFKGNIVTPKKIKKQDITRHRNMLKRKFNIDFSDETIFSEDDIDISQKAKRKAKKQNTRMNVVNKTCTDNNELTETMNDNLNSTRDLNSLDVQIDSDAGLMRSVVSDVSSQDETQEISTDTNTPIIINELYSEKSDDFDF